MDTALWITANDMKGYFYLSDEILRVQMVPRFAKRRTFFDKHANVAKLQFFSEGITTISRYALYHIWNLAQVYMTKEEADAALRKFMNERPRGNGWGVTEKE